MRERLWILLPAVAMSLGWGWRGYIGGGPFGAMIPGAMVALVLCLLAGLDAKRAALVAAISAVGVGFGGEMTYGQTVGFARDVDSASWGLLGLALKGGVWGLLGGSVVGMGFHLASGRRGQLFIALVGLVAGAAVGWAAVNRPKLLYFSDPVEKPREEVWAGLLLGAVLLLILYFLLSVDARPVLSFALAGALGGWFGFGGGGLWIFLGSQLAAPEWIPWWKLMEFTFGLFFGAALGWVSGRSREWINPVSELHAAPGTRLPIVVETLAWAASASGLFIASDWIPLRFGYVLIGTALLAIAANWVWSRWWIALAVTAAAFFLDWYDYVREQPPWGSPGLGAAITAVATVAFCWMTLVALRDGQLGARRAFWLLAGWATVTSWGRVILLGAYSAKELAEHVLFLALLGLTTWLARELPRRSAV